ncbi:MAG: LLM class flavin-dependent oxidoreductase [Streptosporangiales bacterium]|nr:LLM class flavin-dependent oxidoreductase [Streptosporangiales bacterium]
MEISCAFATSMETPDWIAEAERLGYRRAWCYDSPALYPDVWMILALAAERTTEIGLGPAVLVPSLRDPMVNAAAIASLAELAPGRVAAAIGAGFTGRMVLGRRPMKWAEVAAYVRVLRALLRGETADWEGSTVAMLHPSGYGAARPVDVPILIGADGPKGMAVAAELGDGVFSARRPQRADNAPAWRALLQFGTVLDEGEDPGSPRVAAAAGQGLATAYHAIYERKGAAAVDRLPGGRTWRHVTEAIPRQTRHMAIHEGHLIEMNERDRAAWDEARALVSTYTLTGTPAQLRERLAELEAAGMTEIAYQPAGPDIGRELRAFAKVAGLS